jgi:hypothetical protein
LDSSYRLAACARTRKRPGKSTTTRFSWLNPSPTAASPTEGGTHEAAILAGHDWPVRLTFRREESTPCPEMVVFDARKKRAKLPKDQPVSIELVAEPAEHPFTRQMGSHCGAGTRSRVATFT